MSVKTLLVSHLLILCLCTCFTPILAFEVSRLSVWGQQSFSGEDHNSGGDSGSISEEPCDNHECLKMLYRLCGGFPAVNDGDFCTWPPIEVLLPPDGFIYLGINCSIEYEFTLRDFYTLDGTPIPAGSMLQSIALSYGSGNNTYWPPYCAFVGNATKNDTNDCSDEFNPCDLTFRFRVPCSKLTNGTFFIYFLILLHGYENSRYFCYYQDSLQGFAQIESEGTSSMAERTKKSRAMLSRHSEMHRMMESLNEPE